MSYKALDKELIGKWVLCVDAGTHVRQHVWEREQRVFDTKEEAEEVQAHEANKFVFEVKRGYPLMEIKGRSNGWPIK